MKFLLKDKKISPIYIKLSIPSLGFYSIQGSDFINKEMRKKKIQINRQKFALINLRFNDNIIIREKLFV